MICFRQTPDAGSPLSSVVCLLVTGWLTKVDAIKWSASGALKRLLKKHLKKSFYTTVELLEPLILLLWRPHPCPLAACLGFAGNHTILVNSVFLLPCLPVCSPHPGDF